MPNVRSLAEYRHREDLAVLRRLQRLVLEGKIRALAICARMGDQTEEVSITGDYRANPVLGVGTAMKLSWRLTQLADEREAMQ